MTNHPNRSKPRKISQFEEMARTLIGDGKAPDLFFVSDQGRIITISRSFPVAYAEWRELAARYDRKECALENRSFGVIASVEPESDEPNARLCICDDSASFNR